MGTIILQEGR